MSPNRVQTISIAGAGFSVDVTFRSIRTFCKRISAAGLLLGALIAGSSVQVHAANGSEKVGRVTGLAIPRFVSLKAGAVNLRVGPGRKYAISWLYKKRGLPVEVIQEFDRWRRVRDSQGTTGWVLHSLLSSRRTALVAPWDREFNDQGHVINAALHDGKNSATKDAYTSARLQAGLLVDIRECSNGWCSVEAQETSTWVEQEKLFGTYPGEPIED